MQWSEKASYTLKIEIPATSHDAKVSRTNFDANGELRAAIGSDPTTAPFGVIRSNGGAEVHTTMKSTGVKRVFVFSNGEWSCKSQGCNLTFAKIGPDDWELICNGTEKYYIPDAVIFGGQEQDKVSNKSLIKIVYKKSNGSLLK